MYNNCIVENWRDKNEPTNSVIFDAYNAQKGGIMKSIAGIEKIKIPRDTIDFSPANNYGIIAIRKYMPKIMSIHSKNARKEENLYNYYLGQQDILNKTKMYKKDQKNNNKICENHALRQVDFKVGYITDEQREYTIKGYLADKEYEYLREDMEYFYRYLNDVNFFGKDKNLKEWIYITGIGVTDVRPRTDLIIKRNGIYDFANKSDGYDSTLNAPFTFNVLSPYNNFVVYSSNKAETPLFSVSMVEVENNPTDMQDTTSKYYYQVETNYAIIEFESDLRYSNFDKYNIKPKSVYTRIPLIEHSANNSRLGVIEKNKTLFDSINTIISSTADAIVSNSNLILVFKNAEITGEEVVEMVNNGAILLKSTLAGGTVINQDLDVLKLQIDFDGLNSFYEQRVTQAYDIVGVPLASTKTTSGGDTGQARLLGGGWVNAKTISINETNTMKISDNEVVKQIIDICKMYPNCPIKNIDANQIDIKYKISNSDNFLTIAQGIQDLYSVNMPKKTILKWSGVENDVEAIANQWEDNDKLIKQEEKAENITINTDREVVKTQ